MVEKKITRNRNLTQKQLDVLRLLFRFRFATSDLISEAQNGIARASANNRLSVLVDKGYIDKKHDGRARLQQKPAIYSLAAKGRAALSKQSSKYSEKVLNAIRANRDSSERFINHNLSLFATYNMLNRVFANKLIFLTKSNLAIDDFDYLPDSKPDAFFQLAVGEGKYFFLYLLDESTPDFALMRRVTTVFEYEKSGKWQAKTGRALPTILLVCGSNRLQTTMTKRIGRAVRKQDSDFVFATATLNEVLSGEEKFWKIKDEVTTLADL